MAKYISALRLRRAIDRLSDCRAQGRLIDFLVLKRGMKLSPDKKLTLEKDDDNLNQAIDELMRHHLPNDNFGGDKSNPYFKVCAAARDTDKHGFMSYKFPSNGTADTIRKRPLSQIVAVEGDSPKRAYLKSDVSSDDLAEILLIKNQQKPLPNINDLAVWYFRGQDIENIVGDDGDEKALVDAFCERLGLTDEEVSTLFDLDAGNA